jgi:hypothetical protein
MRFGRNAISSDPLDFTTTYTDAEIIGILEPVINCLFEAITTLKGAVSQNPVFFGKVWELGKERGPKLFVKAVMGGLNFEALTPEDVAELFSSPALERLITIGLGCINSKAEAANGKA